MKLFLFAAFATIASPLFAQKSGLKPDPKTVFGKLDNGFRYIIRPNAEPPERFSVRLHIAAGSLMEEDNQRGVAHFLEHMVFNGSRNFTAAELIPKMQRLGIAFGAHANAYTSFDETVYMLDLPNQDEETVDLTYTVMRDFADGALLKIEEIDKERGVIISEKTSRDSVGYRMMLKQFQYLLPGSHLNERIPIGTEEVINNASRERFTDFYRRFYTPERMTFVVAGDFDAKEMEKRVRESFISLANPKDPGQDPPKDSPPSGFGFRTKVFTDKEITADDLTLYSLRPYKKKPDTKAERIARYPLSAANAILSRRFDILAKKENSPILGGSAGRDVYFEMVESGSISVSPGTDQWQKAIPVLEQELRRVIEFGFTKAELDEVTAQWINHAEQAVKRAPTRESSSIAMEYVRSVNSQSVVITPQADLELTKEAIATLTPEKLHTAFKAFWDTKDISFVLTTKEAEDGTDKTLAKLYEESQKLKVDPPVKDAQKAFAYTDFGTPGKVTSSSKVEDLDITQLVLSNNIRVNLKKTDFQKNSINLLARFGSGTFTMPQDKPALDRFASTVFQGGGLGQHSEDDLQRILAGKNVGAGLMIDFSSHLLMGRTTPEDLELQLQLMCAYLTDPGYRPEAERQFKMQLPMIFNQLKHTMSGSMMKMQQHMTGDDYRSIFPKQETLASYTSDMAKNWLAPALKEGPLELSLVGDFDPKVATEFILKTFGALPERKATKPDYAELRKIKTPELPAEIKYTFESKIPNAMAVACWKIPTAYQNLQLGRRFNLLSAILNDRMREEIRENLGGSYSPRATAMPHPELDFGYLRAMAQVKPEETQKYAKLMVDLADKLANEGLTKDELERAFKPIESNLKETKRDNGYWLNTVLSRCQAEPHRLDLARERDADYASISVEELNKLAAKYLKKSNSLIYEVIPEIK